MNQTIDQSSPSPTPRKFLLKETVLIWSIILAGAILLSGLLSGSFRNQNGFFISLYPWVQAGGRTIDNGLKMFGGNTPELPTRSVKISYVISLISVFVVFPTLFFFGLRKRAMERALGTDSPIFRKSTIQFILGGIVTFGAAVPSIPIAVIQYQVSNSMKKAQSIQGEKDDMINELNTIAWKLSEYHVLPKELGGGSGSFVGCTLSPKYTSTAHGTYTLELQDSMVVIQGSSRQIAHSGITAALHRDFKLKDWIYSGEFE